MTDYDPNAETPEEIDEREAYEAVRLYEAQMYASLKRENRRRARQEGMPYPPCDHQHVNGQGYCINCGERRKEWWKR